MKVLNKHGLPRAIALAMEGHKHVRGEVDYTATELFKPPLMLRLERLHEAELSLDIVDGLRAFYGTAIHAALAAGALNDPTLVAERRCECQCGKWKIGGTTDLYDSAIETVFDYKFTSVYSTIFGELDGAKKEWVGQLNCYAYVLRNSGVKVSDAAIVALYSDWREAKTRESDDYPKLPVGVIPVTLYAQEVVEKSLIRRCELRDSAMAAASDSSVPQCTSEERWEKPTKYAVYFRNKPDRAVRVLDSIEQATDYIAEKGLKGTEIRIRQGESLRCKAYCSVNRWCPYWNSTNKERSQENG